MAVSEKRPEAIPWETLTDSGRALLREIAFRLDERWTGRIVIEVFEGGVRDYSEAKKKQPGDLGRKRGVA